MANEQVAGLGPSQTTSLRKRHTAGYRHVNCNRNDPYVEDGSWERPFKTIQAAINSVTPRVYESMEAFTVNQKDALASVPCLVLAPGVYNEDVVIDRTCMITGVMAAATIITSVTVGSASAFICALKGVTVSTVTAETNPFVILEANIGTLSVGGSGAYVSVVGSEINTLNFTGGGLTLARETQVTDLAIALDGASATIYVRNSSITTTITATAANDEEVDWTIWNSMIPATWTVGDFETIMNINSVIPAAVITAAAGYTLLTASPAEPE